MNTKMILGLLTITICLAVLVACDDQSSEDAPAAAYQPDWEDLSRHNQSPEWFSDAKLGIYFTWGPYTVPAFNSEWYPWFLYRPDHLRDEEADKVIAYHEENFGPRKEFGYHQFVPMFKAEKFDAQDWAKLFKETGARFAGPCAQHHDGFAMWKSKVNPWNAYDKGPKRDVTGELAGAVRAQGMRFITTFHHARNIQHYADTPEKWGGFNSHFAYHPDFHTSSQDPVISKMYGNLSEQEFYEYWGDQLTEVVDQYSPDIVWFDSWVNLIPENYRQGFAVYYLNHAADRQQEVVIAFKQNDFPKSVGILDIEQGGKKDLSESVWLTDLTLSLKSWSYIQGQEYKTADLVVRNMIDVWSKNGIVLLNVSPKSDGVIPQEQRSVLKQIGAWIQKHEEAVYETRPFDFYGFGSAKAKDGKFGGQSMTTEYSAEDGRFMKSKDGKYLYLFMLGKPEVGSEIEIRGLAQHDYYPSQGVKRITVLGSGTEVEWRFALRNFILTVPDAPMDDIATVFKMELN
ncbi:MAG: alpha-L-fucosidase [Verrucomicrobiota bacterium]